ncbi:MAG TPA: demethoxyubiquinone hydroxylase family protein [Polyangia bacterium]|jgi:uncharacterized protein (TIGR02284 family)
MAMSRNIDQLNSYLRGEISAVETYRQALGKVKDPSVKAQLVECEKSHESRVDVLKQRIQQLGGSPATGSGPWGAFAKVVQAGADIAGDRAAVAALERGEDHGLDDYRRDIDKLDPETRNLIENDLLPAAQRTHDTVSMIEKSMKK